MMHEFLTTNREELIERCRVKAAKRPSPKATDQELRNGVPLFLEQLIKTLQIEEERGEQESDVSGESNDEKTDLSEMGETAALHGRELLRRGFTIDEVVHDYGDLCQSVTGLASEQNLSMGTKEFQTLNRCLDNAIAEAVTSYNDQRNQEVAGTHTDELNQRLGSFAHELRNLIGTATLALTAIKAGKVGISGATGSVLDASLVGLRNLVDRSLIEVRVAAGMPIHRQLFSLANFIAEVKLSAALEAELEQCALTVSAVDPSLAVDADRDLLFSAVGNLLQNACKFTHPDTEVTLSAYAVNDRIRIEVEDHCGGLPRGIAEKIFQPFTQGNGQKRGLGLGLSIARRGVEANDGTLSVRDIPGSGCVFTMDLPRQAMPGVVFRR